MTLIGAAVALSFSACTGEQAPQVAVSVPTAPTAPAAPDPNSALAQSNGPWTLTTVLSAASGPLDCFPYPLQLGMSFVSPYPMTVTRTTTTLTIDCCGIPGNDGLSLVAAMAGDNFALTIPEPNGLLIPSRCSTPSISTFTGAFSSDGKHFTALEVDTFHYSGGDTIFTVGWTADAGHQ